MLVARGHQVTATTTSEKSTDDDPGDWRRAGRRRRPRRRRDRRGRGPSGAGCDHPRDDGPLGHARLPALRSLVRPDEPAADGGHRAPPRCGQASGVKRFVAQSFTGWSNSREGSWIKTEDDPLDPHPVKEQTETLAAIKFLERAVLDAPLEGIVVRYGGLYGPGSSETLAEILRKRMFPVIGNGAGSCRRPMSTTRPAGRSPPWSAAGAASTTSSTTSRRRPGVFIPAIAEALGAPKPLHIPAWLGRLFAGEVAVTMMTEGRGSSNAKAKRELGWQPIWPSWRDGFRRGLDTPVPLPPPMSTTTPRRRSRPPRDPSRNPARCRRGLCRSSAAALLDRLSDARQRQRGRRHRPGRVHPLPASDRRRRGGRVAKAYLSAVVTRLAIDHLKSARVRRETYVGEWLPEPLVTDDGAGDPARTPSRPTRCRCRSSSCSSG